MKLGEIPPSLFSSLSSKNSRLYGLGLEALYKRLVEAREAGDECTPKEAKDVIRREFFNEAQWVNWEEEDEAPQDIDTDMPTRIYNRLRDTGWLIEIEEIGYRKITSFTTTGAQILAAIASIGGSKDLEFGEICHGVYSSLDRVIASPRENAALVGFAANSAKRFYSEASALSFVIRELAHQMMNQTNSADQLRTFFKDFFGDLFIRDYRSLHGKDNPTRFRGRILQIAAEINYDQTLLNEVVAGIIEQRGGEPEDVKKDIQKDLVDIDSVFNNIIALLESMERYRRTMTRRTHDAIEYSFNALPDISERLDGLISRISSFNSPEFPAPIITDRYVSSARHYEPPLPKVEIEASPISRRLPPLDEIALRKLEMNYLRRRKDNPARLKRYLDRGLGDSLEITTCDLPVESLDDLLAFLELRRLMAASHITGHVFHHLSKEFSINVVPGMTTTNAYISAPQLNIRRITHA